MNDGSTLFLKAVIYLLGLLVLGLCVIFLGVSFSGNGGIYTALLLAMCAAALPFFFALYQGLLLLRYIDRGTAFSQESVQAIKNIKLCAGGISAFYALLMPYITYLADKDNTPRAAVFGLVIIFATLVTTVFAAVLEKLLKNALEIKAENDLTV